VAVEVDSGLVENTTGARAVVYSTTVCVPGAPWIRLDFAEVVLSGDASGGTGSTVRMTSVADAAWQELNAIHLRQWQNSSAYFNGDTVLVELLAFPHTGFSRILLNDVTVGLPPPGGVSYSICGPTDDRIPSYDPRVGRGWTAGGSAKCSAWLINDCNHCLLAAGHCVPLAQVHFNVPLSDPSGNPVFPPPEDQYAIDAESPQSKDAGLGNDWYHFGCFPNPNTDLTPFEAQGASFRLADTRAAGARGRTHPPGP